MIEFRARMRAGFVLAAVAAAAVPAFAVVPITAVPPKPRVWQQFSLN